MTKYLTNQEIFNKVSNHLIAQGKPSVSKNGNCLYRGPRNLKCAIGCLIPDEFYKKSIEGAGTDILFENYPDMMKAAKLKMQSETLLDKLQTVHDSLEDFERLKIDLKHCATEFRLNYKVLGKV